MFKHNAIAWAIGGISIFSGCATLRGPELAATIRPILSVRNGVVDSERMYRLGRAFQGQAHYEDAAEAYQKALAADPRHIEARNALAVVYAVQGLSDKAELEFKTAIAAAPGHSHLHNNLGYFYLQLGRTDQAIAAFREGQRLDPENVRVLNNLALAEQRAGKPTIAPLLPATVSAKAVARANEAVATTKAPRPEALVPTLQMVAVAPNVWQLRSLLPSIPGEQLATPGTPSPPARRNSSRVRIEVSNGNGVAGLARRVGSYLRVRGYASPRLTNQKPFKQAKSEIQYVAGLEAAARELGSALAIPVRLVVPRINRKIQVRVVLGKGFNAGFNARQALAKPPNPALKLVAFASRCA